MTRHRPFAHQAPRADRVIDAIVRQPTLREAAVAIGYRDYTSLLTRMRTLGIVAVRLQDCPLIITTSAEAVIS